MKIKVLPLLIAFLLISCGSSQYQLTDIAGNYTGFGISKNEHLPWYWELDLRSDGTCYIQKFFDIYGGGGEGTWLIREKYVILEYKPNPLKDDPLYACLSGNDFEGSDTIRILSKNRLKIHKAKVKRRSENK